MTETSFYLFFVAAAILAGLDIYLSWSRMKTYGPRIELDALARQLGRDFGPKMAMAWLGVKNLVMLLLIDHFQWSTWLHVFVGAKLGLAMLQLKSLQLELMVEKLLASGRKKNGN